tara:strand:- start:21098 stop:21532 length:435 start_codon:yes stop_codon:yes gene_type:complete
MKNYISTFSKNLKTFADAHLMVDDIQFISSEKELDNLVFDRKTIVVMMISADLNNEDGRPIYDVDYIVAVIDKGADGMYGKSSTIEESLFVVSQLQDYLQQVGWSAVFGTVDIQTDWDESGELVAVMAEMTAQFGRGVSDEISF